MYCEGQQLNDGSDTIRFLLSSIRRKSQIYVQFHLLMLYMMGGCVAQAVITLWRMRKSSHNRMHIVL